MRRYCTSILTGLTHARLPLKTPFRQMLAGEAESATLGSFPCDFLSLLSISDVPEKIKNPQQEPGLRVFLVKLGFLSSL